MDGHPDATACRLKLVLAVRMMQQQASTTMGQDIWVRELHHECDRYLDVRDHVSVSCRLTSQEEIHALKMCRSATPRVRNRLSVYAASRRSSSSSSQQDGRAEIKGAPPRVGGRPWTKLMSLDPSYVSARCRKRVQYVQFKPPYDLKAQNPTIVENEMFKLLWKDEILLDEEGGANRQLGVLFLYELFRDKATIKFANQDCTSTFAHIMTRLWQLKNCRWGREATSRDSGEEDNTDPSRELMQLVAVSMHPDRGWPALPNDPQSLTMLERGVELGVQRRREPRGFFREGMGMITSRHYHRSQQENMISLFQQFLETEFKQCLNDEKHKSYIVLTRQCIRMTLNTSDVLRGSVLSLKSLTSEWSEVPSRINDCSEHERSIQIDTKDDVIAIKLSRQDLDAMATRPLNSLKSSISGFVCFVGGNGDVEEAERSATMPFDVSMHPSASPPIARDMLKRLEIQVKSFARTRVGTLMSFFFFFSLCCSLSLTLSFPLHAFTHDSSQVRVVRNYVIYLHLPSLHCMTTKRVH